MWFVKCFMSNESESRSHHCVIMIYYLMTDSIIITIAKAFYTFIRFWNLSCLVFRVSRLPDTATVRRNLLIPHIIWTTRVAITAAFVLLSHTCCKSSSIFPEPSFSRDLNISGWEAETMVNMLSDHMRYLDMILLGFLTLTEEHLQFNETAYKTVKVYGILSISISTDNGL